MANKEEGTGRRSGNRKEESSQVAVTSVDAGCSWGLSVELGLGFCCTCWVVAAGCACLFYNSALELKGGPGSGPKKYFLSVGKSHARNSTQNIPPQTDPQL